MLDDQFPLCNSNCRRTPCTLLQIAGPRHKSEEKNPQRIRGSFSIFCLCFFPASLHLSPPPPPLVGFIPPFTSSFRGKYARCNAEVSLWDREIHRSTNVSRGNCTPEMPRVSSDRDANSNRNDRRVTLSIYRLNFANIIEFIENYRLDLETFVLNSILLREKIKIPFKVVDCKID